MRRLCWLTEKKIVMLVFTLALLHDLLSSLDGVDWNLLRIKLLISVVCPCPVLEEMFQLLEHVGKGQSGSPSIRLS